MSKTTDQTGLVQKLFPCPSCLRKLPQIEFVYEHTIPRFLSGSRERKGRYKVCKACSMKRALKEYDESLGYNVSQNRKFYESFLQSLYEIEALALTPLLDEGLRKSLNRLLFLSIITATETYLSDAFINTVMNEDALIRKL